MPILFIGFPCLIAAAYIIYPSFSSASGELWSGFLFPQKGSRRPRAPLSAVDRFMVNRDWDRAEARLRALGREFPYDMDVWSRLFRLYWVDLEDPERARASHQWALSCALDTDLWPRINRLYSLYGQCCLGVGEEWDQEENTINRRTETARKIASNRSKDRRKS